jgi:hypothetical protein
VVHKGAKLMTIRAIALQGPFRSCVCGVAAAVAMSVGLAPDGLAATHTRAHIYTPFRDSGAPAARVIRTVRGSCFSGSIAADRQHAWRCMSGNFLFDPCFSTARAHRIVLCPQSGPWTHTAIKIKLTKRLPLRFANTKPPSTSGLPWALVTGAGWRCTFITGATSVVSGQRLNYGCRGTRDVLWGSPSRRSEPWTIPAAPANTHTLNRRVSVRTAWF